MQSEGDGSARLPNLITRVVLVFVAPGRLFRILKTQPASLGALALGCVAVTVTNAALPIEVFEQTLRAGITESGGEIPDDLMTGARIAKTVAVIAGPVFWCAVWFLGSAFNAGLFMLLFGYRGTFEQYRSVTAHALLVAALGLFLLTPVRILTENGQLTLTIGTLVPTLEDGLLARTLGFLDLFNLWAGILVGFAASILDGARTATQSITIAVGASLLMALAFATVAGWFG